MLSVTVSGHFDRTEGFLARLLRTDIRSKLEVIGKQGVSALTALTPKDSGTTASAWGYVVEGRNGVWSLSWTNSNINKGVPIAIILEHGHATGTGGWVRGRSYIPRALRPIIDKLADEAWKVVTSA